VGLSKQLLAFVIVSIPFPAVAQNFKEYTVIRTESSQADGVVGFKRMILQAQRADGSRVSGEINSEQVSVPARRFVTLYPKGIQATIDDNLQATTTMYMPPSAAPLPRPRDPKCGLSRMIASTHPVYLGDDTVMGYKTVILQSEERLDDETLLNWDWKAPDLDCIDLRLSADFLDSNRTVTSHFELRVVKIILGQPDPALFPMPQGYTEKSPSEMDDAVTPATAKYRQSKQRAERLKRQDEKYFANHQAFGPR
jgi:hypothetical protein